MKKLLLAAVVWALLAGTALAAYPEKTIVIVCPWGAGGGTDRVIRAMAAELEKLLGQPVVVENRTGGDGAVGHGYGAKARPDGYTLTCTTFELATMHWMGIPSAPTFEDYEHVAQINDDPAAIGVKTDAEWKDLAGFFAWIKANPGRAQFSGTAKAGIWDLARLTLMDAAGLKPEDALWIPSSGAAAAIPEVLGGHISAIACGIAEQKAQLDNGELRALVLMSAERSPAFPGVPTARELGYDVVYATVRGLSAPKGTPKEIVDLLADAVKKSCESPTFVDFMQKNSFAISYRGPAEYTELLSRIDADNKTAMELGGYLKAGQ
ncbi:MAG: tripartite tricarboxylate transporter substrate binding protein [Synergistaceae bacterium]|jgi:tripartite-type tricarboxylate transporter receptor subunit TctC|nr:tripartite tricarboxylate transporter substrate binding protein [Synergistaceae bacterium]